MKRLAQALYGPRGVWVLTAGMAGLAAIGLLRLLGAETLAAAPPAAVTWPLLALGFYLAEIRPVHLFFRREAHSFTLTEIPLVLGLVFVTPLGLVLAGLVGTSAALVLNRRQRAIKLVFNLSLFALIAVVAVTIVDAVAVAPIEELDAGIALAVLGGTTAGSAIGVLAIFVVISCMSHEWHLRGLGQSLALGLGVTVTNTGLALSAAALMVAEPYLVWVLLAPTAILYASYRTIIHQRRQHGQLQLFYAAVREINEAVELETAIRRLLERTREAFRAEIAALALFADGAPGAADGAAGTVMVTVLGPGERCEAMRAVSAPEVEELAAIRVEAAALRAGADSPAAGLVAAVVDRPRSDTMIARLESRATATGLLIVADPAGDAGAFDAADAALFGPFAAQAGAPLEAWRLEKSVRQLLELEQQLQHQAFHDPLTGLANRSLFLDRLEHAALRSDRVEDHIGVVFLDLDDFKSVNDTLGHAAGDDLLVHVAARLRAAVRPADTVARLGGDEFAVLLEDLRLESEAVVAADRLLEAFREPFALGEDTVHMSASAGVIPIRPNVEPVEILRDADVAMYRAKAAGKGQYMVFAKTMLDEVVDRIGMRRDFAQALAEGQLLLHFQPIVQLETGVVTGLEALVRWLHPTRGLLSPREFVPVLEDLRLVAQLDSWVLGEACRTAAKWSNGSAGAPVWVGVNISAHHLEAGELVEDVAAALAGSGLDPSRLMLEVTESAWAGTSDGARAVLESVRRTGVRIALDDFGCGYSSLSYLQLLPVDVLKIARLFVQPLDDPEADSQLARAIAQLGATLGLDVVAEGIEVPSQLERVRDFGCEYGQGFVFSQALEADAARELLRRGPALPVGLRESA